MIMLKHQHL